MSIYISYHPVDRLFASELLAYLRNHGFIPKQFPLNCEEGIDIALSKNDVVIAILRPEYIKSPFYVRLSEQFSNINIFPILRVPITIEDWGENITLNPVADFSGRDEGQIHSNMKKLSHLLVSCAQAPTEMRPNATEIYMNCLETALQQVFFSLDLLEKMNYECDSVFKTPIRTLLETIKFKIVSCPDPFFITGNHSLERTDYLENIAKYRESSTLVCDYLDSQLVAAFMVDVMRHQLIYSSGKTPMPLMLNIENWDKQILWSEWLAGQLNISDESLESNTTGDLILYVYGFEHSPLKVSQFRESFKAWWRSISPPPLLMILCPYLDSTYENNSDYGTLIIRPVECDLSQIEQFYSKYSNRPFAQFILSCIDKNENITLLSYFLENPTFAAILLSVRFEQGIEFSKQHLPYFFQQFISNLWNSENDENNTDFSEITDALSRIAAILVDRQKSFILYDEALKFTQSEILLNKCINRGLFFLRDNKLRFSNSTIQNYFAAIALVQYGVPSQLPRLTLTNLCDRIPQRWDDSVIISSHIAALHDDLLKRIADTDPILALRCVVSGVALSTLTYSYVIDKNLDALVDVGDFRLNFAKLLYKINPVAAKAILVEVLRNARWSLRMTAYSMFQELDKSTMSGLVESLSNINDRTRAKVSHGVRRIGLNTLPTLFQLLKNDNAATRQNAIWAITELKDKACVPALVGMLWDNNPLVIAQAVDTLGKIHDVQSVPYLARCLQYRHTGIRKVVVNALIEIQGKQIDHFVEIVRQMDAALRRLIVLYLSTSQKTTLLAFLLAFSYDEDVDVKIAAIEGLATIAEPHVILRLEECLEDMSKSRLSKSSVSEIVSKILSNISSRGQTGINNDTKKPLNSSQIVKSRLLNAKEQHPNPNPPDSEKHIYSQLQQVTEDLDVVPKANDLLLSPEDAYVSDILGQLRSGKWNASNNAAKILREYVKTLRGNTNLKVVNQILETLNDDNWVIRWTGVETLGWVGNIHVVPHLIQRLTDSNWKVRIAAIRALVEIKDTKAIIAVSKLVSDNNPLVREAAAEALGYLDGLQAITALESAALDFEEFVRLAAVESLGKTRNKVATRTLLSALKDSSEHVRWAAANGLSGIADTDLVSELIPSLSDSAGPYWEQKRICDVIIDILKQIDTEEAKNTIVQWQSNQS